MKIEVIRQQDTGVETLGDMLLINDKGEEVLKLDTLELPWKDNASRVSCIPKNTYPWAKVPATKNIPYPHVAIYNVPGRAGIKIHKANFVRQLLGCIAVGMDEKDIDGDGQKDITDSKTAFDKLMALLPDKGEITIH